MKATHKSGVPLVVTIAALLLSVSATISQGAPRHRPANPRGVLDPRGVFDPRGIADPRGVFDPRGPFDPRNPARYMYRLPTSYTIRAFGRVNYYYCSGTYYYIYLINGQSVYTRCILVNGVPVVPARPY